MTTVERTFSAGELGAAMAAYDRIVGAKAPPGPLVVTLADIGGAAMVAGAANSVLLSLARGQDPTPIITLAVNKLTVETGSPPPEIQGKLRVAWLAQNRAIRNLFRQARLHRGPPEPTLPPPTIPTESPFAIPAAVAITIIGASAVTAWWSVESQRVEMDLEAHTRSLASQANMYAQQVAAAVQTGQPIPDAPAPVQKLAEQEEGNWKFGVGALVGVVGAVGLGYFLAPAVPRRSNPSRRRKAATKRRATKRKANPKRKATTRKRTTRKAAPKRTRRKAATKRRATKRKANPKRKATTRKRTTRKAAPKRRAARRASPKRKTRRRRR